MDATPEPRFRRPALLFPSTAEDIPGDPDPQEYTELAHSSARALLSGVYHSDDDATVERVLHLVRDEGLTDLATLWSGSPAGSLPGALWRLYVLHAWAQRNPDDVIDRYRRGSVTVPGLRYLAGIAEPPDVDQVRRTMDEILRGAFTGDLALALRRAGAVAVVCAHGTAHLADTPNGSDADENTEPHEGRDGDQDEGERMTEQAGRLLSTGEDLAIAARHADAGTLE